MAEATPRIPPRKLILPAAVAAAFAAGAAVTWIVNRPEPEPASPQAVQPPAGAAPSVLPSAPLGRGDMIAAAQVATAAYATGQPAKAELKALVGRRFVVRAPFGCLGAQADPKPQAAWTYDPAKETLTITATPVRWTEDPLFAPTPGQPVEAVEGFWLTRPWTPTEACPPPRMQQGPRTPETLGLATLFEAGASRIGRRGDRPYEVVRKVSAEEAAAMKGFRLVLSGRIAAYANGLPVACRSDGPDVRPVCMIRVEYDRVAFEDLAGETVAEWNG